MRIRIVCNESLYGERMIKNSMMVASEYTHILMRNALQEQIREHRHGDFINFIDSIEEFGSILTNGPVLIVFEHQFPSNLSRFGQRLIN